MSAGRIDIVVFPNGGREIIGRISSEPEVPMSELLSDINQYVSTLEGITTPRKYTGYYSSSFTGISWEAYNEKNPIILVDKKDLGIPYSSEENKEANPDIPDLPYNFEQIETIPMEAASLPSTIADKYLAH